MKDYIKITIICFLVAIFISGCSPSSSDKTKNEEFDVSQTGNYKISPPESGAYLGAYIDFGDYEDNVTIEAIKEFEALVGKKQALIASSSFWDRETFPKKNMELISAYGAVPLVFWSPWDRDEWDEKKFNRFNLYSILEGIHDEYINMWADEAKKYGKPILLAWGIEMNGNWFPWAGIYHGGGRQIAGLQDKFEGPENFKKAYKYIRNKFRRRGANNVEWVFHVNNTSEPFEPWWNNMKVYYPGSEYVDWLAISVYGQQYPKIGWIKVNQSFHPFWEEILEVDQTKPVILGEWGVGHFPESGSQAAWIIEAMQKFTTLPRFKGAIYWHELWQNGDKSYSNLRLNASNETAHAYKKTVANPFWIDRPQLSPTK